MTRRTGTTPPPPVGVAARLSTLDRFLPVWIGARHGRRPAARAGSSRGSTTRCRAVEVDGVSLPIALGLLVMMYPVLAKVRYDRLDTVTGDRRLLVLVAGAQLGRRAGADVHPGVAAPARPARRTAPA